jgi:hypothetical protein
MKLQIKVGDDGVIQEAVFKVCFDFLCGVERICDEWGLFMRLQSLHNNEFACSFSLIQLLRADFRLRISHR